MALNERSAIVWGIFKAKSIESKFIRAMWISFECRYGWVWGVGSGVGRRVRRVCVCVCLWKMRECCVRACVRVCVCVCMFGCVWFVTECVGGCGCERVGVLVIVTEFLRAMRISFECESWGWGGGGGGREKERGGWRWGGGCWGGGGWRNVVYMWWRCGWFRIGHRTTYALLRAERKLGLKGRFNRC